MELDFDSDFDLDLVWIWFGFGLILVGFGWIWLDLAWILVHHGSHSSHSSLGGPRNCKEVLPITRDS